MMHPVPDPWTWRDPALLGGGYNQVTPDRDDSRDNDRTAPVDPNDDGGPGTDIDLSGYRVEATDGGIGSIDEATVEVGASYLVVDTGPWIFGRKVMLPAGTVQRIEHLDRVVHVDRSREQIKNAPEYDPETATAPDYRDRIAGYYEDSYRDVPSGSPGDR
ncbi:PRC-barrel domain containing protein [Plantactinospora sp. GCM10030261]|uniref:PRC-barrel domain containing protein n=1 Tax=Plantactinospora sp. GCM10030261 TaxID=3273420 RepID=UPI00360F61BB